MTSYLLDIVIIFNDRLSEVRGGGGGCTGDFNISCQREKLNMEILKSLFLQ